jgi:Mrp family chromosome partitioning ATPase/capsular polysaccharide biosynthesis protein
VQLKKGPFPADAAFCEGVNVAPPNHPTADARPQSLPERERPVTHFLTTPDVPGSREPTQNGKRRDAARPTVKMSQGASLPYRTPDPSSRIEGAHEPFVRAVRAHRWLVAIIFVLAIVVTVFIAETRSPTYKTSAQVLVAPVSSSVSSYAGLSVVNDDSTDPVRPFQTAASLLSSRSAALNTAQSLGTGWSEKQVEDAIDVLPEGESDVVSVTGSADTAAKATLLTNTYLRLALSGHLATIEAQARSLVTQLVAQQKALPTSDTADLATIAPQVVALRAVVAGHDPNFAVLQQAPTPTSPSGTSKKLIVLLGALAGLIVAIGTATLIERLNRRVRDETEVLEEYPLPVLARVPVLPRGVPSAAASADLLPPRLQEAYRTLRVQLPPRRDRAARTIMFTSPTPGDGKTSSAINLALMLTAADLNVVLIDFDLRKPDIGNRLGEYTDFMEYFRFNVPLSELLSSTHGDSRLRVVSSNSYGDVTPLLEALTQRLPEMLHDLGRVADYVIIDTAPLGQVSDALRVAPLVDDSILVVRPGHTDRTDLLRTRELLDRMGHPPTGLLLIGDPDAGDAQYAYGMSRPPGDATVDAPALIPGARDGASRAERPRRVEHKR